MLEFTAAGSALGGRSEWEAADGYRIASDTEQRYAQARGLFSLTLSRLASLTSEIERLGSALERFHQDSSGTQVLADQRRLLERTLADCASAQARLEQAVDAFAGSSSRYNGLHEALEASYAALEQARLAMRRQEEIQRFARSGCLNASAQDLPDSSRRSPAQELAYALERKQRSEAVLETLQSVIDGPTASLSGTDPAYREAMQSYRQAYERFLALSRLEGELLAEIVAQEGVVARKESELDSQLAEIVSVQGLAFLDEETDFERLKTRIAEELEKLRNKSDDDCRSYDAYIPKAASYFVRLEQGQGLRLSYEPDSFTLHPNDGGDWRELEEYLSGRRQTGEPGSGPSFQQELRRWILDLNGLLQQEGGSDLFRRWGLAAGYVKQKLYEGIDAAAGDPLQAAMREVLKPAVPTLMALDGQSIASYLDEPKFREITGWKDFIRQEGRNALDGMDERERQCFEFYLALNLLGAADEKSGSIAYGFFTDRSSVAVLEYFSEQLESKAESHQREGTALTIVGTAFLTIGTALSWCGF